MVSQNLEKKISKIDNLFSLHKNSIINFEIRNHGGLKNNMSTYIISAQDALEMIKDLSELNLLSLDNSKDVDRSLAETLTTIDRRMKLNSAVREISRELYNYSNFISEVYKVLVSINNLTQGNIIPSIIDPVVVKKYSNIDQKYRKLRSPLEGIKGQTKISVLESERLASTKAQPTDDPDLGYYELAFDCAILIDDLFDDLTGDSGAIDKNISQIQDTWKDQVKLIKVMAQNNIDTMVYDGKLLAFIDKLIELDLIEFDDDHPSKIFENRNLNEKQIIKAVEKLYTDINNNIILREEK